MCVWLWLGFTAKNVRGSQKFTRKSGYDVAAIQRITRVLRDFSMKVRVNSILDPYFDPSLISLQFCVFLGMENGEVFEFFMN